MDARTAKSSTTCRAPGCDREAVVKGLCQSHYRQEARGRPLAPLRERRDDLVDMPACRVPQAIRDAMELEATAQGLSLYEFQRRVNESWFAMHKAGLGKASR